MCEGALMDRFAAETMKLLGDPYTLPTVEVRGLKS
jgi:hypothetical protein